MRFGDVEAEQRRSVMETQLNRSSQRWNLSDGILSVQSQRRHTSSYIPKSVSFLSLLFDHISRHLT